MEKIIFSRKVCSKWVTKKTIVFTYLYSADKPDIDNLMNDSDTEYIVEDEIQLENDTKDTSIITS